MGEQYRSAIFYTTEAQREEAEAFIDDLKKEGVPVVTELLPLEKFYPAEEYHQNYYQNNKRAGYCQLVIEPKLQKVQKDFQELLRTQAQS